VQKIHAGTNFKSGADEGGPDFKRSSENENELTKISNMCTGKQDLKTNNTDCKMKVKVKNKL
jgi:hypothetical protein